MPPTETSDQAVAKLHLGIKGFATVEIPIAAGLLGKIRRRLLPRWHERIAAAGARVALNVPQNDEGIGDIAITFVNFGRREVRVESIRLDWISIGNSGFDLVAANLDGLSVLKPGDLGEVRCRALFNAAAIRNIQHALAAPRNRYSSHRAPVSFAGDIGVSRGSARTVLPFVVSDVVPFLNLYNPSSDASDV